VIDFFTGFLYGKSISVSYLANALAFFPLSSLCIIKKAVVRSAMVTIATKFFKIL